MLAAKNVIDTPFIVINADDYYGKDGFKAVHELSLIHISKEKLKDSNAFIVTEIAWTIFSSTDMIVLSVFVSTKLSSVYSVYSFCLLYTSRCV